MLKKWVAKIKRDTITSKRNPVGFKVTIYSKVCSAQFIETDYINDQLKKEAVPSVFKWSETQFPTRSSSNRDDNIKNDGDKKALNMLKLQISELEAQLKIYKTTVILNPTNYNSNFSIERFKSDVKKFSFYTGLPDYSVFQALFNFINTSSLIYKTKRPSKLSSEEEFF
ncbi:hypothetical protein FQR65_LT16195 [Abscondita terminalis]|nr:hypothetical protein FQR65_LT16195 [Abscondita terminalis]